MSAITSVTSHTKTFAQIGLTAKGLVYCLLGVLTFMAAFHINGQSARDTSTDGVFSFVYRQTGGQIMLAIIALGLLCYSLWRFIQAVKNDENKKWTSRARYILSGLVYASAAVSAARIVIMHASSKGGDSKQDMARELMNKPFGQILVGIGAAILLGVGIYQIYYGLSEKYHKHVDKAVNNDGRKLMLGAGKVGYVARGIVWLLLAWLFGKAAYNANSNEAGDTSKAFINLQDCEYGPYLLAVVGLGLLCYGLFNFVRARYENFE